MPHLRIFGRQDKSVHFLNISGSISPPVSSLVYVLSAFDKVYLSSQSYDVSPESSSRLELGAASMSASGLYTCLVTGGDIPFLEDSDSKTVMVASKFFLFRRHQSHQKTNILSRFDILFFAMKYFFLS